MIANKLGLVVMMTAVMSTAAVAEQSNSHGEPREKPSFSQLDENGDGKLEKSELKGPLLEDFDMIDSKGNGDGYLQESELPTHPPKKGGKKN